MSVSVTGLPQWNDAPIALLRLKDRRIVAANRAACNMLECELSDLNTDVWQDWMLHQHKDRVLRKIFEGERPNFTAEIQSYKGSSLFVRFEKGQIDGQLALMDLTEIREDAMVLQAGYDEFIHVTTELEKALAMIENQKELLENQKSKLENELQIAHSVQSQVFSEDFHEFDRVHIAGFYEAMTNLGGDMWQFEQTDTTFTAVIGDVMGHGVAASLISIAAKTIFQKHFEAHRAEERSLADICHSINQELYEITGGNYYLTACLVRITAQNTMEFATCGHPPILLARRGSGTTDDFEQLFVSQPMLGIFKQVQYTSASVQLNPGDRLLLYTDCLLESFNEDGIAIKPEDLLELMRFRPDTNPSDVIAAVLRYHRVFTGTPDLPDDLAMVCIETKEADVMVRN